MRVAKYFKNGAPVVEIMRGPQGLLEWLLQGFCQEDLQFSSRYGFEIAGRRFFGWDELIGQLRGADGPRHAEMILNHLREEVRAHVRGVLAEQERQSWTINL